MTLILGEPINVYKMRRAFHIGKIRYKQVAQMEKRHLPTYAAKRKTERINMRRRI